MSEENDQLRFLDPWTLLLPEGGGKVIAVAGSGGKSALLARLYRHYRGEGLRVLWTQTVAHAAPHEAEFADADEDDAQLVERFTRAAGLFVGGARSPEGLAGELSPERIEDLRRLLAPDIVLVEAHSPCGTPLRRDGVRPLWPNPLHLAFVVVGLQGVGRIWGPRAVAGEQEPSAAGGQEPRRVSSQDLLDQLTEPEGLLAGVPGGVPVFPLLAGFGSYRDVDGMFALVARLWEQPALRAVLLGELVGEPRIDAAERAQASDAPEGATHLEGERIFAIYPARLDDEP